MHRKGLLSLGIVLTLLFIWGNSLLPREVSGELSDTVMRFMNEIAARFGFGEEVFTVMADTNGDGIEEPTSHLVRKMAHITEFAVLAALLMLRLPVGKHTDAAVFLLGTAVGAVDETLQLISHRGSQLRDVLIDAGGVMLGILLVHLGRDIARRRGHTDDP